MASIEKRIGRHGKVSWRVRVTVKGCPPQNETFDRKTDADRWAKKVESDLRAGLHFPDRQERERTLADLIAKYRTDVVPRYSSIEQAKRSAKLSWWEQQLGTRRLFQLSSADICECLERLARGDSPSGQPVGPATQVLYLRALSHCLSVARRQWKWVTNNQASLVLAPKLPRGRVRFLSAKERQQLLTACKENSEPRLYPLVMVALGTGARQGELLALRWADVDLRRGQAVLQETKNDERRPITLAGPTLEALTELARVRRIDCDLVFGSRRNIAAFPRNAWARALRKAQVVDFTFHDLRHTFASYLAMSGATLAELAEALGHKTLAMVKRYAHLSEAHTSGVVRRMTERFLRQRPAPAVRRASPRRRTKTSSLPMQ